MNWHESLIVGAPVVRRPVRRKLLPVAPADSAAVSLVDPRSCIHIITTTDETECLGIVFPRQIEPVRLGILCRIGSQNRWRVDPALADLWKVWMVVGSPQWLKMMRSLSNPQHPTGIRLAFC